MVNFHKMSSLSSTMVPEVQHTMKNFMKMNSLISVRQGTDSSRGKSKGSFSNLWSFNRLLIVIVSTHISVQRFTAEDRLLRQILHTARD